MTALLEQVELLRQGGDVLRFHNHRLIGQQTVAEHSFHAAQLLLVLHPSASSNLLKAVLHHDIPEGQVGDLTYPAKRRFSALNAELEIAESQVMTELGLWVHLTGSEQLWLGLVDALECACFAVSQARLGHRNMAGVFNNCIRTAGDKLAPYATNMQFIPVVQFMQDLITSAHYLWT